MKRYDPRAPIAGVSLVCHETNETYPIEVPDGNIFKAMRMALITAPYSGPRQRFHFQVTPEASEHVDIQALYETLTYGTARYLITDTGRSFCGLPIIVLGEMVGFSSRS